MRTWVLNMEFKTDDDWRPLDTACWTNCPLACLTKLSHTCHAKERFDKDKSVICPMKIYAEQKVEEDVHIQRMELQLDKTVV